MKWRCQACRHKGPLTEFYIALVDETKDYRCPKCGTLDNRWLQIPRIDLAGAKFYVPTPKQVAMHMSRARNLLWGGRAGTGKSWALRHDAYMRCMTIPGYRVLLLRKNFTELTDTHLDKAASEIPKLTGDLHSWQASKYTGVFKNESRIRFGHCENDDAVRQYLSSEFDEIIFDEGATFSEYQVRFIGSRLRTAKKGVIPYVRIGSNPGAMWLYRYYIAKDITPDEDPSYHPEDYEFIPATVEDNPHVNLQEQELRLNSLPSEALRQMYRDGNWLAVEGQFFTEWRPKRSEDGRPWHVIQELPKMGETPVTQVKWVQIVAVVDWGYDPDPGVCTWFAILPSGRYIAFKEFTFRRTIAAAVAENLVKESGGLNVVQRIGGHDMWMKSTDTGESMAETFARRGFSMRVADTDRVNGWQRLHALLTETVDEGHGPVPKLQVYEPGCPQLARTIPMLQNNPKHPGDILQQNDHWADTARWFSMSRPSQSVEAKRNAWARFPKEVRAAMMGRRSGVIGAESARRA
jgi:phage terminase large subunit